MTPIPHWPTVLRNRARRLVDAIEACRLASEGAITEKGAAEAFEDGYEPLEKALEEFAAAEAAVREVLEA